MKIAVIADDITGAAEFNGIALRYGKSTVLGLDKDVNTDAEIIVVSTDSRSMSISDALKTTEAFTTKLSSVNFDVFFKKTDSVLRGYVYAEILRQMEILGKKRCMLLPANPSMGRKVINGNYFVNDVLIENTSFAKDPDFPATSSSVINLLKASGEMPVYVLSHQDDRLPDSGIIIGNINSTDDLEKWIHRIEPDMLIAGGGDFFNALMKSQSTEVFKGTTKLGIPFLYVSGTTFQTSVDFVETLSKKANLVFYIPYDFLIDENADCSSWLEDVSKALVLKGKAIVSINSHYTFDYTMTPALLRKRTAEIIWAILSRVTVSELFIEGGSTAAAILKRIECNTLVPKDEIVRGVLRCMDESKKMGITLKPGSYALPESIKQIFLQS